MWQRPPSMHACPPPDTAPNAFTNGPLDPVPTPVPIQRPQPTTSLRIPRNDLNMPVGNLGQVRQQQTIRPSTGNIQPSQQNKIQTYPYRLRQEPSSHQQARAPLPAFEFWKGQYTSSHRYKQTQAPLPTVNPFQHHQPQSQTIPSQYASSVYPYTMTRESAESNRQRISQNEEICEAERRWRDCVKTWFPNLHHQTYFVPPLYFSKVQRTVQAVAGEFVEVPQAASDQPSQTPPDPVPPSSPSPPLPLASQVYMPVPPGPLPVVYDREVREDRALQQVLHCLRKLAEREKLVMVVVSQLEFRKYLDNEVDPITAAAVRLLPRPATFTADKKTTGCSNEQEGKRKRKKPNLHSGLQGNFNILMICQHYGLIVGEVRSVGADLSKIPDLNSAVLKAVQKGLKQLNKNEGVLQHLTSDMEPVQVNKTLMFPNITSAQLAQVVSAEPTVQEEFCLCLGVQDTDLSNAVSRCLCGDNMTTSSSEWWHRAVTDRGPDPHMSAEICIYERLLARFCGPATTIEVPTITTPRRVKELRTMFEAVSLTGTTMATLTLFPEQVELINRPGLDRAFLWGPPGTGKTVMLVLKALQWLGEGKGVHLLSIQRASRAATRLIERQLLHTSGVRSSQTSEHATISATAGPQVFTHFYDFGENHENVDIAVEVLSTAAGELFIIVDEVSITPHNDTVRDRFKEFCSRLVEKVPETRLWAASVHCHSVPSCLSLETLSRPVRCPPNVLKEVERSRWFDVFSVQHYTRSPVPAPTDGPSVKLLYHTPSHGGHTKDQPENCATCAQNIADLLGELQGGQSGLAAGLRYRDVFILCRFPSEDMPLVTFLRERGLPVKVLTPDADDSAVRKVALAEHDSVTLTEWRAVSGLERRVVVVLWREHNDDDKLHALSRCTSLLVCVSQPTPYSDEADEMA